MYTIKNVSPAQQRRWNVRWSASSYSTSADLDLETPAEPWQQCRLSW